VPAALRAVRPAAVVCAGIHMTIFHPFPYEILSRTLGVIRPPSHAHRCQNFSRGHG